MKKYFWFNLMCLSISTFLALGIFLIWQKVNEDQKVIRLEDQAPTVNDIKITKNDDLSIFRSSTLKIATTTPQQNTSTLPSDFNLVVPFTSQAPEKNWEEPWQDACEEAALLMLDAYYKNYGLSPLMARDEILKMVKWEEDKSWGMSIPISEIKQMAEEYFHLNSKLQIKIIENPTIEQIKKSIVSGNPVLVVADGKVLPNPHFQNGGPIYHALIIKGYTEDMFITNDPGTQFGANFEYKYDDLINAIHDWNNGDVKNGRVVVLVIE